MECGIGENPDLLVWDVGGFGGYHGGNAVCVQHHMQVEPLGGSFADRKCSHDIPGDILPGTLSVYIFQAVDIHIPG